jgi:hypothetical protein
MPRPIVEVHQTILNNVITPNDPEQSVCLVGLHCIDRKDTSVGSFTFIPTEFDDINLAGYSEHSVNEDGVIINTDLDLGTHTIDGDLSCILKEVKTILGTAPVTASNFSAINTKRGAKVAVLSTVPAALSPSTTNSYLSTKVPSSLYNKLVVDQGSGSINLLTGAVDNTEHAGSVITSIRDLVLNTTSISFSGNNAVTFRVIARTANALYLYGIDSDSDDFISDGAVSGLQLKVGGAVATEGFTFKLVKAEDQVIQITSLAAGTGTVTLAEEINHKVLTTSAVSSLILADSSESLIVSELDVTNPLVVETTSSGDATFKIPKARLQALKVGYCKIYASYTVALTARSALPTSVNSGNIAALLGTASLSNQLGLAAQLCLNNAGSTSINVLSLDLTPADNSTTIKTLEQAFLDALATLNNDPNIYAIVPLTTDVPTIAAYKNAAEAMSAPAKGKFRIVIGSSEGAPDFDYIVGTPKALVESGASGSKNAQANTSVISDSTQNFRSPTSKVLENDNVYAVNSDGDVYLGSIVTTTISSVTVEWTLNVPADGEAVSYYISRNIAGPTGKDRQIAILESIASSLSSNRLAMVFPGKCSISVGGKDYFSVDSYYLSAALAGLIAGLEPHRPKNNISLAGVTALVGSNIGKFSEEEIDRISDSGYFVFVQDTIQSAPYCVHQVMTKYGTHKGVQELTELSVINNYDFVSKVFKQVLKTYVGTHNIVPSTLSSIRASLDSSIARLRGISRPQIGPSLLQGSVDILRQASYDSGTVEVSISIVLPKVLNKIIVELVSA